MRHASLLGLAAVVLLLTASLAFVPTGNADEDKAPAEPKPLGPPRGYVCGRASKPPVIDGRLDEVWEAAPWSEAFGDIEGAAKPAPTYRTRMKMLHDDRCLYIFAEIEEPHVWANLEQHDSVIFQDNDFEVFLNPDGDSHHYAEFEMNAKNTTWDLLLTAPYKDGGRALNAWEIIGLKTAVRVNGTINDPSDKDVGWAVEIAWPWEGLKELSRCAVPPRDGDQWRINFSRVEWDIEIVDGKYRKIPNRPEHNWVWSPQGVIDMHRPERWGYVQFSNEAPGKAAFRPDPTLAARDALHRVYYAQRVYKEKNGRWATSLTDLGLKGLADPSLKGEVKLENAGSLYEASAELKAGSKRVRLRSDALVTVD